jgi:protein O-mannosyl-transferase
MPVPTSVSRAALLVAVITCVAFLNSFHGKFVYDDIQEIERNPALRELPLVRAMFAGNRLPPRPLPYLTFAIDGAAWGTRPFGYHATNLFIHVIAAVALFAVARQTLLTPRLRPRYGDWAVPLALVIAVIWAVHPLQTQAVTYVYQRIESLAGMFTLVALAAFARAAATGWPAGTLAISVAAAAGAMASKENAVVLPLLVLAYDWFFLAEGRTADWLRSLWRRRGYFAALAATWLVLAAQLVFLGGAYQEIRDRPHAPLDYLLTQPGVILHYLRLAIWPAGQRFDYSDWGVVRSADWPSLRAALPAVAVVAAAAVATVVGTIRRRPWGFLGVAFFLSLAPTSSLLPVDAVANEHRMYLALAAVVAAAVLGALAAGRRLGATPRAAAIAAGAVVLLLVVATQLRNQVYTSIGGIWVDVFAKAPDNHRANWMLASIFDGAGETDHALEFATRSLEIRPESSAFDDMTEFHRRRGDDAGAEHICRRGLELKRRLLGDDHEVVRVTLGQHADLLGRLGRGAEAEAAWRELLAALTRVHGPDHPETRALAERLERAVPSR